MVSTPGCTTDDISSGFTTLSGVKSIGSDGLSGDIF